MAEGYGWGVFLAVMAGATNAFAAILQKHAVDRIPPERREHRFMAYLLRNPAWLLGLGLSLGLGTAFVLIAQNLIGPALVPGLSASGLIVLAVGSVKLIGETLRPAEVVGIALMVLGIIFLGYSNLGISGREVQIVEGALLTRLALFTAGLALGWLLPFRLAQRGEGERRGLTMAISGGLAYSLSNLWILPLVVTIGLVFGGTAHRVELLLFVVACVMLVATNLVGLRQVQEAYKFAAASRVQPLLQVPMQIIPILIYFVVFQRSASGTAVFLIPLGVALIIASGFLLARRTAEIESH